MRRLIRSGAAAAFLSLTVVAPLVAQSSDMYEVSARRQITGVRALEADIEYAVGRLNVTAAPAGLLYDSKLVYDANEFEPQRTWSLANGTGQLALSLTGLDDNWNLNEFDEADLGSLNLGLSREVPTALSLAVGAAEVEMDLGGVALSQFEYRTAASATRISFESPNPVRMDRLELAAGAAEFKAFELGNARFDVIEFVGAIGDVHLDFSGDWTGSASGDLRMGLGSLQLTFPRDIGVRIEKKGFLAPFDSAGFEAVDGGFQTPNWDSAQSKLTLNIRAAFGSIDVDFVN
ncbi:MAG: hypothetical protein E4H28_00190 [Gemmatimonadales bacterium]|nr:MAG: hypothetical protein E4H28_00190 [Gemmatimonadales bacterium]